MDRRLNSGKNLVNSLPTMPARPSVVQKPMNTYTPPASKDVKVIAATLIAQGEKTADVCKEFNLSPKQARAELHNPAVTASIERVRSLALDKLLITMGLMTQEKFENASLKDLSSVAANLSRVIDKTGERDQTNIVQFVVHAPQAKSLSQYKTIDV